ncbi:hypothetical protein M8828_01370 [Aeromonas simiae]|uniref:hypothetical protein n=1 Tax=Aeromonas simiae TaxID=218936 RepID=UPI00266C35D8|nr:hypothetical protein [Aeromonas simiae]MDO2946933.1 hypothetical protein [Aeromonas simiae]MDO2954473.1 hypothetical protein [Aeromonas simiae]
MAGLWYRAGTIAVTNGSKKVVGTGTTWKTSVLKPDKGHAVHSPDGRQYELDYVESDTVMYIVTAYAGPTATGQAYAIDITRTGTIPALSRELSAFSAYAQGQYDSWQKVLTGTGTVTLTAPDGQQVQVPALSAFQPTSASLKALQALTPVADRLPYFTGANTAATTPLTVAARALLDDSSPADMRETLALGLLVSVGSFLDFNAPALFGNSVPLTSARAAVSGFSPANKPTSSANWWYTMVYPRATGGNTVYYRQTAISVVSGETYERTCVSLDGSVTVASFKEWRRVYAQDTILGPVSQAGGVPTGAIVERGSNANGEFVKFADGTMLTFTRVTFDFSVLAQNNYGTPYMLYPATFISPPSLSISRVQTMYNAVNIRWVSQVSLSSESSRFIAYCQDSTGLSTSGGTCDYIFTAIGRWV